MKQQSPTQLFMVEPACFYTNTQTTDSNHYQSDDSNQSREIILENAKKEFHKLKTRLVANGNHMPHAFNPHWRPCGAKSTGIPRTVEGL